MPVRNHTFCGRTIYYGRWPPIIPWLEYKGFLKLPYWILATNHKSSTHFSILAGKIPRIEEPGGLESTGLQRVRHYWSDWACMHACNKSSHCLLMSPFLLMSKSRYKEFKSLVQSCECVAWLCLTLCNPMDCSLPGSCPWDFPGKNTGVGCHFLF